MTEYEKEFGVTADDIRKEIARIVVDKREYDDYGKVINR